MVLYDGCIVPYCADTVRDLHPPDVQITVHFQINSNGTSNKITRLVTFFSSNTPASFVKKRVILFAV